MSIVENKYPILEYSTEHKAIIEPSPSDPPFPKVCVMCFFAQPILKIVEAFGGVCIRTYPSEVRSYEMWKITFHGHELGLIQAAVGAASCAAIAHWLFAKGVETLLCCGSCGVLENIPAGHVILPIRALRDEGVSYQYLPPDRWIELEADILYVLYSTLVKYNIPYVSASTWTTDGFYRETAEMVAYRRAEGCQVVEMECAALASVARFYGRRFGQLLYSGDILVDPQQYDDRGWFNNYTARETLLYITLEAAIKLIQA